jgi:hypothetical protein
VQESIAQVDRVPCAHVLRQGVKAVLQQACRCCVLSYQACLALMCQRVGSGVAGVRVSGVSGVLRPLWESPMF